MPSFPMLTPWSERAFAGAADRTACRAAIKGGSRSFYAASLLLPFEIRHAAYALYGFCRLSDDLIDGGQGSPAAIAQLRERLHLAYAGRPIDNPIDRTFADVVAAFAIPRALPEALIDGLEWDVGGVRCETLSNVYAYGARVAGSVGAMMCILMGQRSPEAVARACELGVAMQLTNIARDVGEDARAGRLYLPRSWLREDGLDPDLWLARPDFKPEIARAVARLLTVAEGLYRRAGRGIGHLPLTCRPAISVALSLYREIGREVARRGHDSVSGRARVSAGRKLQLTAGSIGRTACSIMTMEGRGLAPLSEVAYLVAAVEAWSGRPVIRPSRRSLAERIVWVAELFASLDVRQRVRREPV